MNKFYSMQDAISFFTQYGYSNTESSTMAYNLGEEIREMNNAGITLSNTYLTNRALELMDDYDSFTIQNLNLFSH